MYSLREIPSMVKPKIPFDQRYMRELGKNEHSAIFIILIECLFQTNNQRKADVFYQKEIKVNSNQYQLFLKKTFTTKGQITFKQFLSEQRLYDPQNIHSGEFLKTFYYESTFQSQQMIQNIIEFINQRFNVQIILAKSQYLGSGKTQIPKESYAILFQDGEQQYSIIKEQDVKSIIQQSIIMEKKCQLCSQTTQYYIQDGAKHTYCLECLQRKIGYGPNSNTFYTCQFCCQAIQKKQVRELEEKQRAQQYKESQIAPNQNKVSSIQPPREYQRICSKCSDLVQDQNYYQNICNHIFCLKCVENQSRVNTCLVDSCMAKVDYEKLQQFLKQYKSQIIQNSGSDQNRANQPHQSNIYQNRSGQIQVKQDQITHSMQIQPVVQQPTYVEYHHCTNCNYNCKMENLFTNFCGHYYCDKCANRYPENLQSFICKNNYCRQEIDVGQYKQFFQDQKIEQSKKIYNMCIHCGTKLTLFQMFQNSSCKHNICFDCISNAFSNQQQSWLGRRRCPDQECRLSINMEQLENFFLYKQQEKLQELDEQEKKYAMEVEGPIDKQNISYSNILDLRKDKYNQNPKIEQIVQQQRNQSQIISDNRSMIQNGSQLKLSEATNCSMCGEDFTEDNKPIQMDCRRLNHVIGICCFLTEYGKCLCCEKKSPYETVKFKYLRASNTGNYSNYGNNGNYGNYGNSGMESQILQSQIISYPQSSINNYQQSSINGRPQIDDFRMNPKLTQSSNIRQGSNINRRPN